MRRGDLRRGQTTTEAHVLGQPGGAAPVLRRGFSNAELAVALGLLAVIAALLSLQSCPLSFGAGKAKSKQAAGGGQTTASAPPLISTPADPLKAAAQRWVVERQRDVKAFSTATMELQQSLGWMEPRAAATLLEQLAPPEAASLLTRLHRRQIALILEQADPTTAAQWLKELLGQPALPMIPDEFKPAAARAGLYDDSMDVLLKYREAQMQSGAAASGGSATGAATAPPATGQAGATATPPAAGTPTTPQPGTATPPAGGTAASDQAGEAGAAPGAAGAGGTAAPAGTTPPTTGTQTPSVPGGAQAPPGTPAAGP